MKLPVALTRQPSKRFLGNINRTVGTLVYLKTNGDTEGAELRENTKILPDELDDMVGRYIERRGTGNNTVYSITESGLAVIKYI